MSAEPQIPEGMLTPAEYQLLAAPALRIAAEVAAQRGDPHLYNDMASMLALLGMVSALTHVYLERAETFSESSPRPVLEAAPMAVCALVFTQSGLAAPQVEECLRALSAAYLQLLRRGVLGPQDAYVGKAFDQMLLGSAGEAAQSLRQAAMAMTRAVDAWETARAPAQ